MQHLDSRSKRVWTMPATMLGNLWLPKSCAQVPHPDERAPTTGHAQHSRLRLQARNNAAVAAHTTGPYTFAHTPAHCHSNRAAAPQGKRA